MAPETGDVLRTMQGQQGPRFNLGQTPRVEKFEAKTYTVHTVREVYRTEKTRKNGKNVNFLPF